MFVTMCLRSLRLIWRPDFKSGLHMVVTIAEHTCDHVLKSVKKLTTYRLKLFLVTYKHLRPLQLCEEQGIRGKHKKMFATMCLLSLRLIWRLGLR